LGTITAITGIPIPFSLKQNDGMALLLLGCFFFSAFILLQSRNLLLQQGKDFLLHRKRTSIFVEVGINVRSLLFLILQTCILSAICLFCYFMAVRPELREHIPPYRLLGIYLLVCIVYLCLKWVVYSFLGWIFFNNEKVSFWMTSYSTLLYYFGFSLFPFALLLIYFGLNELTTIVIAILLLFLAKTLIFYKWKKLFCHSLFDSIILILYFCALEIIPLYLVYQGLLYLNDCLIIKF
jgi:hypothetical protein